MRKLGIVLILIFLAVATYALYPMFSGMFGKPEYQTLTENFITAYLEKDFRPDSVELKPETLNIPNIDRAYGSLWEVDNEKFRVVIAYGNGKPSLIALSTYALVNNNPSEDVANQYFALSGGLNWECTESGVYKKCKATWFDADGNKMEIVHRSNNWQTTSVALCKIFKESDYYESGFLD